VLHLKVCDFSGDGRVESVLVTCPGRNLDLAACSPNPSHKYGFFCLWIAQLSISQCPKHISSL
jgi:hypothetical protein